MKNPKTEGYQKKARKQTSPGREKPGKFSRQHYVSNKTKKN